jgi:hypothetical protein
MKKVALFLLAATVGFGAAAFARPAAHPVEHSGCCSHHGGVCGCTADRMHARCCDGAISPSCDCN